MAILVVLLSLYGGNAFGYSSVVAFGDSLSDTGNIARFTDGNLWVELLADHLAVPLIDHAYGGATTGYDNPAISSPITGLLWQVSAFSSDVSGSSLITVWAGANDLLQVRDPGNAVLNIGTALENLYAAGGRNFLVPNLPDVGKTPDLYYNPDPTLSIGASIWTNAFNTGLIAMLNGFNAAHNDINLNLIDTFSIFNQYTVGSQEWQDLFWIDGFHPSHIGHELIYQAAAAAVPEPSTVVLFLTGLVCLAGVLGRKRKAVELGLFG